MVNALPTLVSSAFLTGHVWAIGLLLLFPAVAFFLYSKDSNAWFQHQKGIEIDKVQGVSFDGSYDPATEPKGLRIAIWILLGLFLSHGLTGINLGYEYLGTQKGTLMISNGVLSLVPLTAVAVAFWRRHRLVLPLAILWAVVGYSGSLAYRMQIVTDGNLDGTDLSNLFFYVLPPVLIAIHHYRCLKAQEST